MVASASYDWRTFEDPEGRTTEPDAPIPCAVLVAIPRNWTVDAGTVCARYRVHLLTVVWL